MAACTASRSAGWTRSSHCEGAAPSPAAPTIARQESDSQRRSPSRSQSQMPSPDACQASAYRSRSGSASCTRAALPASRPFRSCSGTTVHSHMRGAPARVGVRRSDCSVSGLSSSSRSSVRSPARSASVSGKTSIDSSRPTASAGTIPNSRSAAAFHAVTFRSASQSSAANGACSNRRSTARAWGEVPRGRAASGCRRSKSDKSPSARWSDTRSSSARRYSFSILRNSLRSCGDDSRSSPRDSSSWRRRRLCIISPAPAARGARCVTQRTDSSRKSVSGTSLLRVVEECPRATGVQTLNATLRAPFPDCNNSATQTAIGRHEWTRWRLGAQRP